MGDKPLTTDEDQRDRFSGSLNHFTPVEGKERAEVLVDKEISDLISHVRKLLKLFYEDEFSRWKDKYKGFKCLKRSGKSEPVKFAEVGSGDIECYLNFMKKAEEFACVGGPILNDKLSEGEKYKAWYGFVDDLWGAVMTEHKLEFDQYLEIRNALGDYRTYDAQAFIAVNPGDVDAMVNLYENPDPNNPWNKLHLDCEAAKAVLARTGVIVEGVPIEGGSNLEVEGWVNKIKRLMEEDDREQIVTREIPCGSSPLSRETLEQVIQQGIYHPLTSNKKMLMLIRDIDPNAREKSLKRFEALLKKFEIAYKIDSNPDRDGVIKITAGNLEINAYIKDASTINDDPHAKTLADMSAMQGLWDYFSDEQLKVSFETSVKALKEGGSFISGQFVDNYPSKKFLEIIMNWFLIGRTEEELMDLLSPIAKENNIQMRIFRTPGAEETQMLVEVYKPKGDIMRSEKEGWTQLAV